MQGLLEEGTEAMGDEEAGPIRDLAIIGAAQRVEHYEISAYGTARCSSRVDRIIVRYAFAANRKRRKSCR